MNHLKKRRQSKAFHRFRFEKQYEKWEGIEVIGSLSKKEFRLF